jgi:hypothetical protein
MAASPTAYPYHSRGAPAVRATAAAAENMTLGSASAERMTSGRFTPIRNQLGLIALSDSARAIDAEANLNCGLRA